MGYILGIIGGLIIGFSVGWLVFRPTLLGKLHIVKDETNEAYMFLELDVDVEKVASKEYATFKVTQK